MVGPKSHGLSLKQKRRRHTDIHMGGFQSAAIAEGMPEIAEMREIQKQGQCFP